MPPTYVGGETICAGTPGTSGSCAKIRGVTWTLACPKCDYTCRCEFVVLGGGTEWKPQGVEVLCPDDRSALLGPPTLQVIEGGRRTSEAV